MRNEPNRVCDLLLQDAIATYVFKKHVRPRPRWIRIDRARPQYSRNKQSLESWLVDVQGFSKSLFLGCVATPPRPEAARTRDHAT